MEEEIKVEGEAPAEEVVIDEAQESCSPKKEKKAKKNKDDKKVTELTAQLEKMTEEKNSYFDALLRERANFENYKKRSAAENAAAPVKAKYATVEKFLPVLDNIDRALAAAKEDSPLKEGIEMVQKQFYSILEAMGVKEIEAEGKDFDVNLHNAVMTAPAADGEESGKIKTVLQKGFITNDNTVIRHSMVVVIE